MGAALLVAEELPGEEEPRVVAVPQVAGYLIKLKEYG